VVGGKVQTLLYIGGEKDCGIEYTWYSACSSTCDKQHSSSWKRWV